MKNMLLLCAVYSLTLTACNATPALDNPPLTLASTPQVRLNISGSEDVTAVLEASGDAFQQSVPNYRFRVLSGSGIDPSVKGVVEGVLDIAAMNRLATPAETAHGLKFFQFGEASVVVFTHPGVGILSLTTDQLRDIFTGKITNWSQLGGPDLAIVPYVRNEDNGNTQVLRQAVFHDLQFSETVEVINSGDAMRTAVAVTTGSIGYGAWPPIQATGVNVQAVALDNINPDDPVYPLRSVFGIGYLGEHEAKLAPFIQWLQSPTGRAKLASFGVIIRQDQ
jgi:phosphate transport system substrate-binding protein